MSNEFAKKTTQGIGWNYLSFGLRKILSLAIVSILAHILSPENFGIVALATLTIDYLSVFNDFGLGAAFIQQRDNVETTANTAFTLNIFIGITLTLITFLIAPLVATFFKEPLVSPILRWLGLNFLINAIGSVHKARLQRELNFRLKMIPELGNVFSRGILSVSLALTGFGVWSLVYGHLLGVILETILLWKVVPWRPYFELNAYLAKKLFNYGLQVMSVNALAIFGDSFDYFLIGIFFNSASLGIYTLAYRLPEMLIINTLWVLAAVFFPAFASIQTQPKELQKSFLASIKYVQLIVTPICLGLIVAAEPIIRVVFGDQWLDSIPIMRILSAYALVISVGFHVGDVYKAIGRPDILIKISTPIFIIRIIALWIGAQYSLIGVALAHLVAGAIEVGVRLFVAFKIMNIGFPDLVKELRAYIGGIALTMFALPALYLTKETPPIVQLTSVILAGVIGYFAFLWIAEYQSLLNALKIIGIPRTKSPKHIESKLD